MAEISEKKARRSAEALQRRAKKRLAKQISRAEAHPSDEASPLLPTPVYGPPPPSPVVAMDCEGQSMRGRGNVLSQVCLVNTLEEVVLERYCERAEGKIQRGWWNPVSDKTAKVAGWWGYSIEAVQAEVRQFLVGKVVVCWDLAQDLKFLDFKPAPGQVLDIQKHYTYEKCLELVPEARHTLSPPTGEYYKLRVVAATVLGRTIQCGRHSAAEDAQATMALYIRDRANINVHSCAVRRPSPPELERWVFDEEELPPPLVERVEPPPRQALSPPPPAPLPTKKLYDAVPAVSTNPPATDSKPQEMRPRDYATPEDRPTVQADESQNLPNRKGKHSSQRQQRMPQQQRASRQPRYPQSQYSDKQAPQDSQAGAAKPGRNEGKTHKEFPTSNNSSDGPDKKSSRSKPSYTKTKGVPSAQSSAGGHSWQDSPCSALHVEHSERHNVPFTAFQPRAFRGGFSSLNYPISNLGGDYACPQPAINRSSSSRRKFTDEPQLPVNQMPSREDRPFIKQKRDLNWDQAENSWPGRHMEKDLGVEGSQKVEDPFPAFGSQHHWDSDVGDLNVSLTALTVDPLTSLDGGGRYPPPVAMSTSRINAHSGIETQSEGVCESKVKVDF